MADANKILGDVFAPKGMVAPPMKTEATKLPAPETKKVASETADMTKKVKELK